MEGGAGAGRGQGSLGHPWILKMSAEKVVFLVSSWKKTNLTTFGPALKKFGKKASSPWKKSFRRPGPESSDSSHMTCCCVMRVA